VFCGRSPEFYCRSEVKTRKSAGDIIFPSPYFFFITRCSVGFSLNRVPVWESKVCILDRLYILLTYRVWAQYPYLASNTVNEYGWNAAVKICGVGSCNPVVLDGKQYDVICSDHPYCASSDSSGNLVWKQCPDDWMPNPDDMGSGLFSYDNIGTSMWLLFSHITLEGWTSTMYLVGPRPPESNLFAHIDGDGLIAIQMWFSRIFHVLFVFIGAFVVVQLGLAIIAIKYFAAQEEELTLKARIALDEEAILLTEEVIRSRENSSKHPAMRRSFSILQKTRSVKDLGAKMHNIIPGFKAFCTFLADSLFRFRISCRVVCMHRWFPPFILTCICLNTVCMAIEYHDVDQFETNICQRRCDLDARLPANATCTGPLFNRTRDLDGKGQRVRPAQKSFCYLESNLAVADSVLCSNLQSAAACYASSTKCFWVPERKSLTGSSNESYKSCKLGLYSADEFGLGSGVLSLRQMCGGGEEGTNGCPAFDQKVSLILGQINLVLTIIFILEMALKMLAMGFFPPALEQEGFVQARSIFKESGRMLITASSFRERHKDVVFEGYFNDGWNFFDFAIVMFSIVEFIISAVGVGQTSSGIFSVLRTMRLFRLIKLFRHWHEMQKLVGALGTAVKSLNLVLFLYLLVAYIMALFAMENFARSFKTVKTANPRSNFDNFWTSFLTVFQIVTAENWTTIAYNCITVNHSQPSNWGWALIPFVYVLIGNYVIMNLFVAILLSKMTDEDVDESLKLQNEEQVDEENPLPFVKAQGSAVLPKFAPMSRESSGILNLAKKFKDKVARTVPLSLTKKSLDPDSDAQRPQFVLNGVLNSLKLHKDEVDVNIMKIAYHETFLRHFLHVNNKHGEPKYVRLPAHNTLCIFSPYSSLRQSMAYISHHPWFEKAIIGCILLSSIQLMIEAFEPAYEVRAHHCRHVYTSGLDCTNRYPGQVSFPSTREDYLCPKRRDEKGFGIKFGACGSADEAPCCKDVLLYEWLQQIDNVFTVIFLFEMIIKIITEGVWFHPRAYLRSVWNVLDAGVVIVSIVSWIVKLIGTEGNLKALKTLRCLRVLRPLRIVKRNPQLKTTVICIIGSLPALATSSVVLVVYIFVIAMLMTNLFKGSFFRCYGLQDQIYYGSSIYPLGNLYTADQALSGPTSVPTIIECVTKTQGLGVWHNAQSNFDNVFTAMMTLFEMSTTEGWLQVMASTIDSLGSPGLTPLPNTNPGYSVLCLLHVMIGFFVMLNLVVSGIINNYVRIKNRQDGLSPLLTEEQRQWREDVNRVRQLKPRKREKAYKNPWRNIFKSIAKSGKFETCLSWIIFANFVVMLSKSHDESCQVKAKMVWVNLGFAAIFAIEAAIKVIGLGVNFYFMDSYNRFDFLLVLVSFVVLALDFAQGEHLCTESKQTIPALTALRAIRIARLFRLVTRFKGLQNMISTLYSSLSVLANILMLIVLILFIMAVLGTMLFWNVNQEQGLYKGVDGDGNYERFDMAFFLLFRQSTGETWNAIMRYCSQSELVLACADTRDEYRETIACGSSAIGPIYHLFWQIFGTYMLMQLVAAVILEKFEDMVKSEVAVVSQKSLDQFVDKWSVFDPDGTSFITVVQLTQLISELNPPLGINSTHVASTLKLMAVVKDLDIPVRQMAIPEPGSAEPGNNSKYAACVKYHDTFIALVRRAHTIHPEDKEIQDMYASSGSSSSESDQDEAEDLYAEPTDPEQVVESRHHHHHHQESQAPVPSPDAERDEVSLQYSNATIAQDYAARQLQHACMTWREIRLQVNKGRELEESIPLDMKAFSCYRQNTSGSLECIDE